MPFAFHDIKPKPREARDAAGPRSYVARRWLVLGTATLAALGLVARAALLQTEQKEFLQDQGDARHVRVVKTPAHRGVITDRHGQALAISTPVDSVWAIPRRLATARDRWPELAKVLSLDPERLHRLVAERIDKKFVYLRRHVSPEVAESVRSLGLAGVSLQREYRRYYPAGEVAAHVIGFTNIDDQGQEGLELLYDEWLRGIGGAKQVIQDRLGRVVEDVANVSKARPGQDIRTSLDLRIQTLAYRSLKEAVSRRAAKGGSAVVLDAGTGEILAMVNQPSYNPNRRGSRTGPAARNRAMTDVIEPGSTVKPFTIAAALESKVFQADSPVDTSPGMLRVGRHTIRDVRNLGLIDVATVLKRSSNVGASRIALATPPEFLWRAFSRVGFGESTATGFPGESGGILTRGVRWSELERATLAFGYGLSVTPLQLARAYLVFAHRGQLLPVTFQPKGPDPGAGLAVNFNRGPDGRNTVGAVDRRRQAISLPVALHVRRMLEAVVSPGGTGHRAQVFGYRVAGKTGTVRKSARGGYADDRYMAVFAGLAPASDPRLVMVVVIDEPQGAEYYGGQIAAPVFAEVIAGALRLLRVPPDQPEVMAHRIDLTNAILEPHSGLFSPPSFDPPKHEPPAAQRAAQRVAQGERG